MKTITLDYVLKLHTKMINATGGSYGVRDIGLLESALAKPFVTFDGVELYPSLYDKCAAICHSIIKNHPFIDGNKRTGIYIMLILLEYNGISLKVTDKELVELGIGIAENKIQLEDIINWIKMHK